LSGAKYNIEVCNPQHLSKGVVKVEVDGKAVAGYVAPYRQDGGMHRVTVTMG
jgi:cellobiose phosphorylase